MKNWSVRFGFRVVSMAAVCACALFGGSAAAQTACAPLPSGLVSWWAGEGDAQDNAGVNNGYLANGAAFAVGEVGQGFVFPGAGSRVTIPDSPSLRLTGEFTIELWYKDTGCVTGTHCGLIAKRAPYFPGGCNFGINMLVGSHLQVYYLDPNYPDNYRVSTVSPIPAAGVFHHLAATFRQVSAEQVEVKTYIDGQLAQTDTLAGNLTRTITSDPVLLGASSPSGEFFVGIIDEASIFSRALSAAEILAIFSAGASGKCIIAVPPSISIQPASQTVDWGSNVTFTVGATGLPPVKYQWNFNSVELAGATTSSLTLTNVQLSQAGAYSVLVSNAAGVLLSSNAVLTVQQFPPAVLTQPTNQDVELGSTVSFTVSAAGLPPVKYQWNFDGAELAGATTSSLTLTNVQLSQAGAYSVLVSNAAGVLLSSNAILTVQQFPPVILTQPTSRTVWPSEEVTFTVQASGTQPLYQWSFNGVILPGATRSVLTLIDVNAGQAGDYAVLVSNAVDWVWSSNAVLTVRQTSPLVTDDFDPAVDATQWSGMSATVLATNYGGSVSGSNALWFGGDTSRYAVTRPLDTTSGGVIQFYLRLADGIAYPWEIIDLPGEGVVLESSTDGGTSWSELGRYATNSFFNWRKVSLTIPPVACAAAAQFRWRQLSSSGAKYDHWALDDVLVLGVPTPPAIVVQPQDRTVTAGGSATFTVAAVGALPLSYQWLFNGAEIVGATDRILLLTNVQSAAVGGYSVAVTNFLGSIVSSNATLAVNPPPPCAPAPAGLVASWSGEGDGMDGAGTNAATLVNGVSFAPAVVGQGFSLDGQSRYLRVPDSPSLRFTNALTLELWFKDTGCTPGGYYGLIAKRAPKPKGCNFGVNFTPGSPGALQVYFMDTNHTSDYWVSGYSPMPAAGVFHHLAATFQQLSGEQVEVKTYIDGTAVKTNTFSANLARTVNDTPVTIGTSAGNGEFFKGIIDEVALYSRALSSAEVSAIYGAGSAGKCFAPVPPSIVAQPASQTIAIHSNATFTVVAAGTPPLSYQWSFSGFVMPGATNSSLTLTNVDLSQAGAYVVQVTNSAGTVVSSNAVLTVSFPPAQVLVANTNVASGGALIIPVVLVANGNENAIGFSLNFSPTLLTFTGAGLGSGASGAMLLANTNLAGSGQVGFALAMPADTAFPAGALEVVHLTFAAGVVASGTGAAITFGDQPVLRQLSDVSGYPLSAGYSAGTITIAAAEFEGDVSPRPNGNQSVTITDWVLVGRYVARLDYPTNSVEFQRADCAPLQSKGDGAIRVTDWVQTGRFAAGLDPVTIAGGPASEGGKGSTVRPTTKRSGSCLRLSDVMLFQTNSGVVTVNLASQGNENGFSFSVTFDPALVTYVSTALGSNTVGANLNVNATQAGSGRVGVALALATGSQLATGTQEILKLTFRPTTLTPRVAAIAFADQPVPREVSDAKAVALSTEYINGTLTLNPVPSLRILQGTQGLTLAWPSWGTNFTLRETSEIPASTWTSVPVVIGVSNDESVVNLPMSNSARYYRLERQ